MVHSDFVAFFYCLWVLSLEVSLQSSHSIVSIKWLKPVNDADITNYPIIWWWITIGPDFLKFNTLIRCVPGTDFNVRYTVERHFNEHTGMGNCLRALRQQLGILHPSHVPTNVSQVRSAVWHDTGDGLFQIPFITIILVDQRIPCKRKLHLQQLFWNISSVNEERVP